MAVNLSSQTVLDALSAISRTTSATGSAVDLQPYISNHELKAFINQGTGTGTTVSVAVKIQESDSTAATTFTDISGAAFTALASTTATEAIQFQTTKRYVRVVSTHGTDMTAATYYVGILAVKRLT